jgi:hypothetical protein
LCRFTFQPEGQRVTRLKMRTTSRPACVQGGRGFNAERD